MLKTCHQLAMYFFSLLGMLPVDENKPLIIVEGTSDLRSLKNIFNGTIVPVYDPRSCANPGFEVKSNRQLVIEAAKWLKHEKKPRHNAFVAIIDADYDRVDDLFGTQEEKTKLEQKEADYQDLHIFMTDWHDLDVHVFWETIEEFIKTKMNSPVFRKFIEEKKPESVDWKNALRELLIEVALEIGLVRLSLHRSYISQRNIGKTVTTTKYIDSDLNVMEDEALKDAASEKRKNVSEVQSIHDSTCQEYRILKSSRDEDIDLNIINGHDLFRILGLCIVGRQGRAPGTLRFAEKTAPAILRSLFSIEHLQQSDLLRRMESFAKNRMKLFRWSAE